MSRLIVSVTPDLRTKNINSQLVVAPKAVDKFLADYRSPNEETEAERAARLQQSIEAAEKARLRKQEEAKIQTAGYNFSWLTSYFKTHPKIAYPVAALTVAGITYTVIKNMKK